MKLEGERGLLLTIRLDLKETLKYCITLPCLIFEQESGEFLGQGQ